MNRNLESGKRRCIIALAIPLMLCASASFSHGFDGPTKLLNKYCADCHGNGESEGGFELSKLFEQKSFDGTLAFENQITHKMPPSEADQPSERERLSMLNWIAKRQPPRVVNSYRRKSRSEYNHGINDLLNIDLNLIDTIPDDRGTNKFDSDRRILLTKEMLSAYFSAADTMLEYAFPSNGFYPLTTWRTNRIRESHPSYRIYNRPYEDGILFSWTRANNGNSYSFFYDGFAPPESGWYELTFDAKKVGDFNEDLTIQVHAGKYYYADDRTQPQRLLDVISVSKTDTKSYTVRGFLHPGESVSVHCFHEKTWRKQNPKTGVYIKQLKVRGPLRDWPPRSFQQVLNGVALVIPPRGKLDFSLEYESKIEKIGGSISVSSFQKGMEKENMLDGSKRTFWHTQFSPKLASPPHYVIIENPKLIEVLGLTYGTWSGGNGNGQIKAYEVHSSDDGKSWEKIKGNGQLEIMLDQEQPIIFSKPTKKRFIKFLITDSYSIDGRSLASIGKLDVILSESKEVNRTEIRVKNGTEQMLSRVIGRFAENAFSSELKEEELDSYRRTSLDAYEKDGDFLGALKLGLKTVICSHRFLFAPGKHKSLDYKIASDLARTIWLSVPDQQLLNLAKSGKVSQESVRDQIDRMLRDDKSKRMIHSFCGQWLNLRSFRKVSPSLKLYPLYDELLDHYLPKETESYVRYLINENLPVGHLIDSDFSFLNQRLARHYQIENVVGQEMRKVMIPKDSSRGGLLTMGSILKITTDGFHTSPILRGAWVSQNIAGNTLAPPPEEVKAIEVDTSGAKTPREQIELHKNIESCAGCHKSIDPYGFALESFDATGQDRKRYRNVLSHKGTFLYRPSGYFKFGGEVDTVGEIAGEKFDDVLGLKKLLLSNHKKLAYNFMKQFFEYTNGHEPTLAQRIVLYDRIPDTLENCGLRDLIKEVLIISFLGNK